MRLTTTNARHGEMTHHGLDKIKRYGWEMKDEPGKLGRVSKHALQIHPAYQRDLIEHKAKDIAANWSWVACGAIVVGHRGGEHWVIDGQHRVIAARRRSDIDALPCVIFETTGIKQEAIAFLDLNTGRKPVTAIGKFKALIAAGDEVAIHVAKTFDALALTINNTPKNPGETGSVFWAMQRAAEDRESFELVLSIGAQLAFDSDLPLQKLLLDGLWYIHSRVDGGMRDERLVDRLQKVGGARLTEVAKKAAHYFTAGGGRIWGTAMLEEVNKGLRKKYHVDKGE